MANFVYTNAKRALLAGELDLNAHDIRVALVMTNTTADTEQDMALMNGFATLDEMDGANYVRKALANEAVAADDPNDRGEFDADNVTWSALGAGTRLVAGAIVYRHVNDDTDSIPIAWIDTVSSGPPFPYTANGADLTFNWDAQGIIQAT